MKFYRYEAHTTGSFDQFGEPIKSIIPNVHLYCTEFNLHKETPKGYWIGYGLIEPGKLRGQSTWVSKTSKKRYAYPTKEEALTNYIKRTQRRSDILKTQVDVCKAGIAIAKDKLKELVNIVTISN